MSGDPKELVSSLAGTYSAEHQAIAKLVSAPTFAGDRRFSNELHRYCRETERHLMLVRGRLSSSEKSVSLVKAAVMNEAGEGIAKTLLIFDFCYYGSPPG